MMANREFCRPTYSYESSKTDGSEEELVVEEEVPVRSCTSTNHLSVFGNAENLPKNSKKNNGWMKDGSASASVKLRASFHVINVNKTFEVVSFDPKDFKARQTPQGLITSRMRKSLLRPAGERDRADLDMIWTLVERINAFSTYPRGVRKDLARNLQYQSCENGSVVLKEGQFGCSLYFIINGTVAIELSTGETGATGGVVKQILNEKMTGDSFGEAVTVAGSRKAAAVVCKTACEFLKICNDDIEEVLKTSYLLETERRMKFLQSLDLFDKWVQNDIKLLNSSSRVVEYAPNLVVIKDMRKEQEYSYFIMSGQCHVVRQLSITVEELPFGKEKITLASVDNEDDVNKFIRINGRYQKMKNVYLVIQSLREGQFFGVDEDIGKSSIITVTKTEFLRIPKCSLQSQQRGSFYSYISNIAMKRYPNRSQTFQRYLIGLKWDSYKRGLVQEVANKRSGRLTACARDVPKCLLGKT